MLGCWVSWWVYWKMAAVLSHEIFTQRMEEQKKSQKLSKLVQFEGWTKRFAAAWQKHSKALTLHRVCFSHLCTA